MNKTDMLNYITEQKAMRSRSEVEEHLHTLVGILAGDALADNSAACVRAVMNELIWVLYPGLTLAAIIQLSDILVERRKNVAQPHEHRFGIVVR